MQMDLLEYTHRHTQTRTNTQRGSTNAYTTCEAPSPAGHFLHAYSRWPTAQLPVPVCCASTGDVGQRVSLRIRVQVVRFQGGERLAEGVRLRTT